jgi:hypothetical protein|tara:strand:- start:3708 stop:4034 length:327 start_codon:yes stop_codon:yes gene_type:complete
VVFSHRSIPSKPGTKTINKSSENRNSYPCSVSNIWKEFSVKRTACKYKLEEAGVKKLGRTKLGGKQQTVYYRVVDKILPPAHGHPLFVELADGQVVAGTKVFANSGDF